ncbi:16169_t:CDS:2 [Racocetra persica]|uniref:16169_t:CDS:1 n=1 Tax=Racocetra persica TaxID=160502 RepID=A0ACA9KQ77_9GLOM|nr:16169_t:CDS:2 [Racocetra persica]
MTSKFKTLNKIALLITLSILYLLLASEAYFVPRSEVKDGCAKLAKNIESPSYEDVKSCYEGIKYDDKRAKPVIDVVDGIMSNFYIFFDQAKETPENGFSFEPIDLKKELNLLRHKHYKSDFEFITIIRNLISQLKDAHTHLDINCYNKFSFSQSLSLYSIKHNNQQKIKILEDDSEPSNKGCEVIEINGQNALKVIKEFANKTVVGSRDLGVRFNLALASLTKLFGEWSNAVDSNQFADRSDLPETPNIAYKLSCSGKQRSIVRKWSVVSKFISDFNDTKSYFEQNCLPQEDNPRVSSGESFDFRLIGDIGVARIGTLSLQDFQLINIKESLQSLSNNAKKLVIDLSNNSGGFVGSANVICALLLQSNGFFPGDIKITNITKPTLKPGGLLDISDSLSFPSGKKFSSIKDFIGNNFIERGGTTSRYSNKFTFQLDKTLVDIIKNKPKLRWTKNNTIILTNGFCGSACAQVSQCLAEIGQFPTVAVGGLYNSSLSFSSFVGGEVLSYDNSIKINGIPDFPLAGELQFTAVEAYSTTLKKNKVLDFLYRPATHRIHYNDQTARDPRILWNEAAKFLD